MVTLPFPTAPIYLDFSISESDFPILLIGLQYPLAIGFRLTLAKADTLYPGSGFSVAACHHLPIRVVFSHEKRHPKVSLANLCTAAG